MQMKISFAWERMGHHTLSGLGGRLIVAVRQAVHEINSYSLQYS